MPFIAFRKRAMPRPRVAPRWLLNAEQASAQDFGEALDALLDLLNLDTVKEGVANGDLVSILDVLDLLEWATIERRLIETVTPRMVNVMARSGTKAYDEVVNAVRFSGGAAAASGGWSPPQLPPTDFSDPPPSPGPRGGIYATTRFDMTNPYAIRAAEQFAADLVREVSRSTRMALRDAVTDAFRNGVTGPALARRLRDTIGLTTRQARAVESYRQRLLDGGMDEARVDVLTRRYWRQTRNRRAETIARTEIQRASNHGRLLAWQSAGDHGLIDLNQSIKEWVSTADGPSIVDPSKPVTCPVCSAMDGKKVMGAETPFRLGSGREVDMPPAHPNCRCTAILHPPGPPEDYDPEYPHAQV